MISTNFYGQFSPKVDELIRQYFPNKKYGRCIEVGAVDGIYLSNTLHFEQSGWDVLCIEPIPNYYNKLKKNRKNSLNFAISDENKDSVEFTVVRLSNSNESAISGLNIQKELIPLHSKWNPELKKIKVSCRRLDWCIEKYFNFEDIDFISIDTEGTELDVLKSFDVNNYNIKLLVVENNFNDSDIELYLNTKGWIKDKRVEVNDFYIKN
jgi:FkbM family methyltransferase